MKGNFPISKWTEFIKIMAAAFWRKLTKKIIYSAD